MNGAQYPFRGRLHVVPEAQVRRLLVEALLDARLHQGEPDDVVVLTLEAGGRLDGSRDDLAQSRVLLAVRPRLAGQHEREERGSRKPCRVVGGRP